MLMRVNVHLLVYHVSIKTSDMFVQAKLGTSYCGNSSCHVDCLSVQRFKIFVVLEPRKSETWNC